MVGERRRKMSDIGGTSNDSYDSVWTMAKDVLLNLASGHESRDEVARSRCSPVTDNAKRLIIMRDYAR